ncbi:MAG: hypothetical protein Q9217_002527 [Psora testacea]
MDEFAQTRAPDDLFDDDFTPLSKSISRSHESKPFQPQRNHERTKRNVEHPQAIPGNELNRQKRHVSETPTSPRLTDSNTTLPTSSPVNQPRTHTPVLGDRHLTGGLAKPKLTEEELNAKLAAAKLNNAKRAEAHRLAEADEASFQQREVKANMRRQEEGRARRQMDLERERNRVRKLKGMEGREWDEGKEEQRDERGSQYRRGVNGGVGYRGRRANELGQDGAYNGFSDRQRGGNEPRGRGRGGRGQGGRPGEGVEKFAPDSQRDFPTLPKATKPKEWQALPPDKVEESLKAKLGVASWADQVTEAKLS